MKLKSSMAVLAAVGCMAASSLTTAQDGRTDRVFVDPATDRVRGDVVTDRVRPSDETDTRPDWRRDGRLLRCGSIGMGHTDMHGRYAVRGPDRVVYFQATFETGNTRRYAAGDLLDVYLSGVQVGTLMLEQRDRGTLGGKLQLHAPYNSSDASDYRLSQIRVGNGSSVVVGPLGCALDN